MRDFSLCKTLKIKNPLTKLSICDILIELLEVFGEVAQGLELPVHTRSVVSSNLTLATIRPVGQEVKTTPFHGVIMGSIPVRVTNIRMDACHPS